MGCAPSKKDQVCKNCHEPLARRSYSMHVHHPPQRDGDTYHVVALTSSTLGSLKLDTTYLQDHQIDEEVDVHDFDDKKKGNQEDFPMGMIEAKSWSKMIDEKITKVVPRTPIQTPPGEPETIDAFELMKGLEDTSPLHQHYRSFSFSVNSNSGHESDRLNLDATSIISEFDPDIIAQFRKSLEELPPANPFHLKPMAGVVADSKNLYGGYKDDGFAKPKVILYFTSLRGVRKTYEDCCHVRVILRGMNVKVDERDVSMHSGFKEELKELLGNNIGGGLPKVFLGKKYIGGAEEVRRMNEDGQLEEVLEGCQKVDDCDDRRYSVSGVCKGCGDVRFIPCETCSGSCKIYYEADEYDEEVENEEVDFGFQRCPDCNENGLIRCPLCCN
ncbi:Glutaredoxin domain-containing protein [Heracleum sosnowskyi]|uniref:Glutaredoxin domain-containing protein n=1 Tax=Heracleum sosnowskyi TaxID=360622 RepID=A0AAD8HYR5_9APIA|nr:Glutaredoxin domain-containing protein [Heracleum sosnowskyi]